MIFKPKIAIYGTGLFGQATARMAHKKGWNIVAAFNRDGNKIGQDLGLLAGEKTPWGVPVQNCDKANYSMLDADVAIVAMTDRLKQNLPAYERLLAAGVNVICHGTESYFPRGIDSSLHEHIDSLARQNSVSFLGTGVWDHSRIWSGILAAGPCMSLTSLFHKSITNVTVPGTYTEAVGIGLTPEEFDEKCVKQAGPIGEMYHTIPQHVLYALGYTIKSVSERREPVLFDHPVYSHGAQREIPVGISAGTRILVDVETQEGVTASAHMELRVFEEGETNTMHWTVNGNAGTEVTVARTSGNPSAVCMLNRIPDVLAAEPGIRLVSELGPLKPTVLV